MYCQHFSKKKVCCVIWIRPLSFKWAFELFKCKIQRLTSGDEIQKAIMTNNNYLPENTTQEEGRTLCIPCIAPHSPQNFSLFWTFTSSREPTVILRYDSRHGHIFNLWEGRAELDPDQLLLGNGSLLLHKPDSEEHSGTYTCTFSGLQSRHVVQTTVNITVASLSEC